MAAYVPNSPGYSPPAQEDKAALEEQVAPVVEGDAPVLSQRQQKKRAKKLARRESLQEKKKERKAAKKARNDEAAEKKKEERDQQFAAMTSEEKEVHKQEQRSKKRARDQEKQHKNKQLKEAADTAPKIIIDLDFWDKMTDGEQVSLVSQLGFCVGANRKSDAPCSLHYTSILAQTKKQFPQHTNWPVEQHEEAWEKAFEGKRPSIVYLTADASEQIDTLDKDSLYVVGGIVDRNRYPQLCLKKAQELGVRTAKLPIGEYLKLTGSKVLTVNQTVGILVKFWSCKDWKEAVTTVVPTRKGKGSKE